MSYIIDILTELNNKPLYELIKELERFDSLINIIPENYIQELSGPGFKIIVHTSNGVSVSFTRKKDDLLLCYPMDLHFITEATCYDLDGNISFNAIEINPPSEFYHKFDEHCDETTEEGEYVHHYIKINILGSRT